MVVQFSFLTSNPVREHWAERPAGKAGPDSFLPLCARAGRSARPTALIAEPLSQPAAHHLGLLCLNPGHVEAYWPLISGYLASQLQEGHATSPTHRHWMRKILGPAGGSLSGFHRPGRTTPQRPYRRKTMWIHKYIIDIYMYIDKCICTYVCTYIYVCMYVCTYTCGDSRLCQHDAFAQAIYRKPYT